MPHHPSRAGKQVVLIAVVVGAVVAGVLGGALLGPRLAGKSSAADAKGERKSKAKSAADPQESKGETDEETVEHEPAVIISLGEFLVNLHCQGGLRYLQAEVSLAVSGLPEPAKGGGHGGHGGGGEAKPTLPEAELALAKDRVVALMSAADFQTLRGLQGREQLKKQIAASLQKTLPDYEVQEVLFTSFVMQ